MGGSNVLSCEPFNQRAQSSSASRFAAGAFGSSPSPMAEPPERQDERSYSGLWFTVKMSLGVAGGAGGLDGRLSRDACPKTHSTNRLGITAVAAMIAYNGSDTMVAPPVSQVATR
jgi:hypothetical protein